LGSQQARKKRFGVVGIEIVVVVRDGIAVIEKAVVVAVSGWRGALLGFALGPIAGCFEMDSWASQWKARCLR